MIKKQIPLNRNTTGQKRAFTPDEVKRIREALERNGPIRDLALFCVGIDTMLRSSDLLKLCVHDVRTTVGEIRDEFTIKMQKTGVTVRVAISPNTARVIERLIKEECKTGGDYLFTSVCSYKNNHITRFNYARLVKKWCHMSGIQDVIAYSTHSLRRTRAAYIYNKTKDLEVVRQILGHTNLAATSCYLGVDNTQAMQVARQYEL